MNVSLSPELQKRIAERIERGEITNTNALVEHALNFYLDYEAVEAEQPDFVEMTAAIDEAIEQGDRGERRIASEVFEDLRAKYGLSR